MIFDLEDKVDNVGKEDSADRGKNITRRYILSSERAVGIRQAIQNGAKSITEIANKLNTTRKAILNVSRKEDILLPKGKPGRKKGTKRKPEIDNILEQGLSLREIGVRVGLTLQAVEQYLYRTGQKAYLEERRRLLTTNDSRYKSFGGKEQLVVLQSSFLSIVRTRTEELAKKEGFATQKAVEYIHSLKFKKGGSYPFELLHEIFRRYKNASNKGRKLSVYELAKDLLKNYSGIRRILKRVKLEPMYGKHEKHIERKGKYAEATKRAFKLPLPTPDVDYFLGIKDSRLTINRFSQMGEREKFDLIDIKVDKKKLTYRLVSEIYEARDCKTKQGKFTLDEIAELVGADRKVVDRALKERDVYEPFLIECLQELYNDENVKTPYVTKMMRERLQMEG